MISVIITLFNKEEYIVGTINSVLSQSYTDFELIIVDDGSTDNSAIRVNEIIDDRIRLLRKRNGGVSSARNYGIKNAKGEYIILLDADDKLERGCLEILYTMTNSYHEADVITGNFKLVENERALVVCTYKKQGYISRPEKLYWKRRINPRIGNTLIKKSVFNTVGLYNESMTLWEDLEFNVRLFESCRFAYTPEILMYYNRDYSSLSKMRIDLKKEFSWHISLDDKSRFIRLILANNINQSMYNRIKNSDIDGFKDLYRKHIKKTGFLFYALITYLLNRFFISKIH